MFSSRCTCYNKKRIAKTNIVKMSQIPVVSVVMITYGHENYIRQAIEGVLMQQCNFNFELIIANDFSPDKTDVIIRDILKTHPLSNVISYHCNSANLGMMPNFVSALKKVKGKYIAICEGDDYWTDPLKLQKQVDFLEANIDFSLHYFNALKVENGILTKEGCFGNENLERGILDSLNEGKKGPTLTMCFRAYNVLENPLSFKLLNKELLIGDWPLEVICLMKGKAYYDSQVVGVYRVLESGAIMQLRKKNKNAKPKSRYVFFKSLLNFKEDLEEDLVFIVLDKLKKVSLKLFFKEKKINYLIDYIKSY